MPNHTPVVMTPQELCDYIRTWYAHVLREWQVDVVTINTDGVSFGFPSGNGGTDEWQFIQYKNGQVGARYVVWKEYVNKPIIITESLTKAPDINALMMLEHDADFDTAVDPSETPSTLTTNYRRY
jgi:hypothetical protein